MKKLYIVASTKGGVSKSFWTRLGYEAMCEKYGAENVILVDCDHRVKATEKAFPGIAIPIDLSADDGPAKLVDLGENCGDNKHILVDFAGGSLKEIQELMRGEVNGSLFFDLYKDFGFDITVIIPFTYEVNSQMAFKDVHAAYGDAGVNVDYFFVQNLKGITYEKDLGPYFQGYDGTLDNIANHPQYSTYVPQDFAIEKMGLDTTTRDDKGTTSNLMRVHQMPGNLAIWVDDTMRFRESSVKHLKTVQRITAVSYFNELKNRLLRTDLLK